MVEAKQELRDNDIPQLIAQMGIVHTKRKKIGKNCLVYGILATSIEIQFYMINNDGVAFKTRHPLNIQENLERVLYMIDYILQRIVDSTPNLSRFSSAKEEIGIIEITEGVDRVNIQKIE